jgi:pantetheine-phosphate adenylyltransferase
MKRGIYAGSFDPITRGHLDVIRRASLIVDQLHIMIGVNPKKSSGFFAVEKRLKLIEESLEHMAWFGGEKRSFHVGAFSGLLVDYCRDYDIRFNIRGLRAAQDFNYEFEMHGINCDMAPDVNTVFLIAPPEFQFISSSTIRELATHQSLAVSKYVTPSVATALFEANRRV